MTHSAISKNLSILEGYLGYELFNRVGRTMTPTMEAEILAKAVREAEDLIDGALRGIAERRTAVVLNIAAPATFAMRWLVPRLPDFASRYGHIRPQIRPTHTPDDWLAGTFDIVLRRGADIPGHLAPRPLFTETMGLIATEAVADRVRAQGGLRAGDLISADTRPGELDAWLQMAGLERQAAEIAERYPHNYIALEAALAGRGAIVASLQIVAQFLEDGHLVEVFPGRTIAGETYYVGYDPRSPKRSCFDAFAAWLETQTRMPVAA